MAENKEWLDWINDQINDMYTDDYVDIGNNRVFKTTEDDREIALYLLKTLKDIIEDNKKG